MKICFSGNELLDKRSGASPQNTCFASFSIFLVLTFSCKKIEKAYFDSVFSAQHPNANQNIKHIADIAIKKEMSHMFSMKKY